MPFTDDLGHWVTELPVPEESPFGFIYELVNIKENKSYIGKKQIYKKIKRKPLKGKKNKRISDGESDWRSYTSSSNQINDIIAKEGKDNFQFKIIKFCHSKWELAYWEAKTQFDLNVLFRPEKYYNGIVNLRIGRPPKDLNTTEYLL